jgi:hypothetical protein
MGPPVTHEHGGARSAVQLRSPQAQAAQAQAQAAQAQAQAAQAQALRGALEKVCATGLLPAPLCDDAQALCDDVEAGQVSADHAADEIRALLGGIALRAQGIGQPCCRIADVLLAELASTAGVVWAGRTVPGGEDRANARTGLVELRFPASDFWALPAVAHEMGHVLARAPQLGKNPGSGNAARRVIDEGVPAAQRQELFCDFYATYVLGPAFPALMILDRLRVSEAASERPFPDQAAAAAPHPTPDKRVLVMLQTLALLDQAAGPFDAPHAQARSVLDAAWRDRLAQADKAMDPHPDAQTVLSHLVNRLWAELDPVLRCRFSTPMAARTLARDLRAEQDDLWTEQPVVPVKGIRVLDVVAAAWQARITEPPPDEPALSGIAARALAAAETVAGGSISRQESGHGQ